MAIGGQPAGVQEADAGSHTLRDGHHRDRNRVELKRVLPPEIAQTETQILQTVIQYGTGKAASVGQFAAGKTGTTSNYGDAWFVGWDSKYTVAVWVGYPTKLVPMTTEFNGTPVLGGTFPALIWHSFMMAALQIDKARGEHGPAKKSTARGAAESGAAPEGGRGTPPPRASGNGRWPPRPPPAHAEPRAASTRPPPAPAPGR